MLTSATALAYASDPELFVNETGAPVEMPDSIYKKIRRNLHLKKTDRERFREEGMRRRQARKIEPATEFSRVSAHCVCESFELTDILSWLMSNRKTLGSKPTLYTDVICFKDFKGRGDVFVFSYGGASALLSRPSRFRAFSPEYLRAVVVFWGFSEDEESKFLHNIKSSQGDVRSVRSIVTHLERLTHLIQGQSLEEPESDDFLFSEGVKSDILVRCAFQPIFTPRCSQLWLCAQSDSITLMSSDILEKLSASFAIAQCVLNPSIFWRRLRFSHVCIFGSFRSVKLSVFEERIESQIENNKHLPERLAKHGKIDLDRVEIVRFCSRHLT